MVPISSYEIPRVSHYSGYYLAVSSFIYWTFTTFGLLSQTILLDSTVNFVVLYPRCITTPGLGSSSFARHYSRNRVFFLFLWVLRCFSSPRSLPIHYFTHVWITRLFSLVEFPHSDIHGSLNICFSPWLFAAYHVLLRLLVPRYPPYALCSLTYNLFRLLFSLFSLQLFFLYEFDFTLFHISSCFNFPLLFFALVLLVYLCFFSLFFISIYFSMCVLDY